MILMIITMMMIMMIIIMIMILQKWLHLLHCKILYNVACWTDVTVYTLSGGLCQYGRAMLDKRVFAGYCTPSWPATCRTAGPLRTLSAAPAVPVRHPASGPPPGLVATAAKTATGGGYAGVGRSKSSASSSSIPRAKGSRQRAAGSQRARVHRRTLYYIQGMMWPSWNGRGAAQNHTTQMQRVALQLQGRPLPQREGNASSADVSIYVCGPAYQR